VEVWDWDAIGRDDFLGKLSIDLRTINDNYDVATYSLEGKRGENDRGKISLRIRTVSPQKQGKLQITQLAVVKERIVAVLAVGSTELALDSCGLSTLPLQLGEKLAGITLLDLSFNQFVQWPDLSPLTRLEELILNGNLLVNISASIASLTTLRILRLTGNQLVSLPPEISRLTGLENLVLANNQIMTITQEIGRLNKLETLDLSGNPIQKLPPHIGGLRCLESLDMSGCNLSELPEEFTLMTRLIEINLGNNQVVFF
jgi:Leucine-rich repeat (LRR) protein